MLAAAVALTFGLVRTAGQNLAARHMGLNFDYLSLPANFDIPFHTLPWATSDSYAWALLVALANTLLVSALGIVAATLLGLLVGVMRLSVNWLLRMLAASFVELVRNTPQLVQIVFWYFVVLQILPSPRQSIMLPPGILLNIRGLYVPSLYLGPASVTLLPVAGGLLLLAVAVAFMRRVRRWAVLPGLAACGFAVASVRAIDWPVVGGFNVRGGAVVPPELVALWLGLSIYSAAFIAEIVRGAIEAVPAGQTEAARALGLRPQRVLLSVVLPQAVRMMVPPLTSQYLNLVKSSSLGAAIAYPELFQIFGGTVLNQSGREIETMAVLAAIFLSISLAVAALMNWYNRRVAPITR